MMRLRSSIGAQHKHRSYSYILELLNCINSANIVVSRMWSEAAAACVDVRRYGVEWLYSLSFMLYPVIGCAVTIVVGIIVSLITAAVWPGAHTSM